MNGIRTRIKDEMALFITSLPCLGYSIKDTIILDFSAYVIVVVIVRFSKEAPFPSDGKCPHGRHTGHKIPRLAQVQRPDEGFELIWLEDNRRDKPRP